MKMIRGCGAWLGIAGPTEGKTITDSMSCASYSDDPLPLLASQRTSCCSPRWWGPIRIVAFLLALIVSNTCLAQHMTYSKAEETRFNQLNHAQGDAKSYSSIPYFKAVVDSIDQFLETYPNSIYTSALLFYKLELSAAISSDSTSLNQLVDSILQYDSMSVTKLSIADVLIKRNISPRRGVSLLYEILPMLTVSYHRYRALLLLAQYDMSLGNLALAQSSIEKAINTDSTRYEAWYLYLLLSRTREDISKATAIQNEIQLLEQKDLSEYSQQSSTSPYLFKSISAYTVKDIKGNVVPLASFRNKITLINFFAFWCASCKAEFPELQSLSEEFPEVLFLYVNTDGDPVECKKRYLGKPEFQFLKTQRLMFVDGHIQEALGITFIPRTFIIDKQGVIRFDHIGYIHNSGEVLKANILQLLHE